MDDSQHHPGLLSAAVAARTARDSHRDHIVGAASEGVAKGWQISVGAASAANGLPEINDLRGHSRLKPLPQGPMLSFSTPSSAAKTSRTSPLPLWAHPAWSRMRRPQGPPIGGRAMDGPQQLALRAIAHTARRRVARVVSVVTALLILVLTPAVQAQFVSACGSAPSGINNCPWYQVEIVIFRNDDGRAASAEDLVGTAQPRWSPRLATLLPPAGEDIRPMRTAEYLALWQSAGQAPEWLFVTPGLSVEQERFLQAIEHIGRPRHLIDLSFLDTLHQLDWAAMPSAEELALSEEAEVEPEPEERSIPEIEPTVVITQPMSELEAIDIPDLVGVIPMDWAFREVPDRQRLLNGEAARLRRARGIEVLGHLAWRQPFMANEAGLAQLVYSADLAESGPAGTGLPEGELLLGTLTVDLRRFLHAHLDLYFKAPGPVIDGEATLPTSGASSSQWVHVQQSRRMRSGELHYLDHPWIGAIIRIERFEAPSSED